MEYWSTENFSNVKETIQNKLIREIPIIQFIIFK